MDINDLNKYQLVLLTLFMSFVVSIATGIVTVSLLQQAPLPVTNAINKVIERTIEKVTPTDATSKPQTIIIREDDLIAETIATGFKEVVQFLSHIDATTDTPATTLLQSLGIVVDTKGSVVLPTTYISNKNNSILVDNMSYDATNIRYDSKTGISVVTLVPGNKDAKPLDQLTITTLEPTLRIGQTALITGANGKFVKSVITDIQIPKKDDIGTTFTLADDISKRMNGAPVFSSDGKLIGMVSFDSAGNTRILGVDILQKALDNATPVKS